MSSRHIRGALKFATYKIVLSGDYTVVNESMVIVDKTSGAATAITIPVATSVDGRRGIWVVDAKGDAATNNITIAPSSGTINGAASYVISENYGAVLLLDDSGQWVAIATANPVSAAELAFLNGVTAGTVTASKAVVVDANKDVATIRHLTISGNLVTGSTTLSEAELGVLDSVTAGTGAVSKALVLDASGNIAMPNDGMFGLSRASVAAAGSTASDATVLADQVNAVTGADGATGVALPAAATTEGPIWVINTVESETLLVYPVDGGNDQINGLAEDVAFQLAGGEAALFIPTSATQWYARLMSSTAVQKLATEGGAGVVGDAEVYATSVQRSGGIITTRLIIDLTGLDSSGSANDVIGDLAGGAAHLGQITAARNGTIFAGRITCMETPAGGDTDIDIRTSTAATGAFDDDATGLAGAAALINHGAWTAADLDVLTTMPAANAYLYLAQGGTTDATYSAGRFLIELFGYDA